MDGKGQRRPISQVIGFDREGHATSVHGELPKRQLVVVLKVEEYRHAE